MFLYRRVHKQQFSGKVGVFSDLLALTHFQCHSKKNCVALLFFTSPISLKMNHEPMNQKRACFVHFLIYLSSSLSFFFFFCKII